MGKHNDSMNEQGDFQTLEMTTANQPLRVSRDATNVMLISPGSSTLVVSDIRTERRPGRKLRFMVRADQGFTARFSDTADHIKVVGGIEDIRANDSIELICNPISGGKNPILVWTRTATTNIT